MCVQPDKPYQALTHFGTGFLSRFEGSQCPARLLEEITIVDTPGAGLLTFGKVQGGQGNGRQPRGKADGSVTGLAGMRDWLR